MYFVIVEDYVVQGDTPAEVVADWEAETGCRWGTQEDRDATWYEAEKVQMLRTVEYSVHRD